MRLIDADALMEELMEKCRDGEVLYRISPSAIDNAPTITPKSLVRRGRWIERVKEKGQVYCSECATIEKSTDSNYKSRCCPNCGAKMDLEE